MERMTRDVYFMGMALLTARRSPCLRKRVGCVLVDWSDHILSAGYNGPPRGWPHCSECKRTKENPEADFMLCAAVHAEINALLQCREAEKVRKAYVTHFPCPSCMRALHNTGCERIFFKLEEDVGYHTIECERLQ